MTDEVPFELRQQIREAQKYLLEARAADYRPTTQAELDEIATRAAERYNVYREFCDAIGHEQFAQFCAYVRARGRALSTSLCRVKARGHDMLAPCHFSMFDEFDAVRKVFR
jgi:hypothetical protein